VLGDALQAVMCGAGHNMRLLLRKLRLFCAQFGLALQKITYAEYMTARTRYRFVVWKNQLFRAE